MSSVPTVRPGTSAATRARLLDATLACLAEHGVAGTTSRRITETAGANLAAITYHFGSKDALVAEALTGALRSWLEPALTELRTGTDPAARTLAAMQALRRSFDEAASLLPAYYEALVGARPADPIRRAAVALLDDLHSFLAGQIAELRASGYLPEWVDPDAMAALQLAAADGVALHRAMGAARGPSPDAVAAQMAQLLFAGRQ